MLNAIDTEVLTEVLAPFTTWLASTLVDAGESGCGDEFNCVRAHSTYSPGGVAHGVMLLGAESWDGEELWNVHGLEFDAPWWVPLTWEEDFPIAAVG